MIFFVVIKRYIQNKNNYSISNLTEKSFQILSNPTQRALFDKFGTIFLQHLGFEVVGYQSQDEFKAHIKDYQDIQTYGGFINFPVQFDLKDFLTGTTRVVQTIHSIPCICPQGGNRCTRCKKSLIIDEIQNMKLNFLQVHLIYIKFILIL